jgi:hypothetical protein
MERYAFSVKLRLSQLAIAVFPGVEAPEKYLRSQQLLLESLTFFGFI